jgi:hypothetical protein
MVAERGERLGWCGRCGGSFPFAPLEGQDDGKNRQRQVQMRGFFASLRMTAWGRFSWQSHSSLWHPSEQKCSPGTQDAAMNGAQSGFGRGGCDGAIGEGFDAGEGELE